MIRMQVIFVLLILTFTLLFFYYYYYYCMNLLNDFNFWLNITIIVLL